MLRAITASEDRKRIWRLIESIQYVPEIAADHAANGIVISPEERLETLKRQLHAIIFGGEV